MTHGLERRLLQIAIGIACLVPFAAGGAGVIASTEMLKGAGVPTAVDLDSHYRYLSGLLFGLGVMFASCIPRIERKTALFRGLALVVLFGGLARLLSLVSFGVPGNGHLFGLAMELGVVPALAFWQARMARISPERAGR